MQKTCFLALLLGVVTKQWFMRVEVAMPGRHLWTPAALTAAQRADGSVLAAQFSDNEAYVINRYLDFCDINSLQPTTAEAVALCAAQMLDNGCRGSYVATYARTVKKFCQVQGIFIGCAIERIASNVEFACRDDSRYSPAVLSTAELDELRRAPDVEVALITEMMHSSTFRCGDVQSVKGAHVKESPQAFLITLFGGKNHRKSLRVGKCTLAKRGLSAALVRHLRELSSQRTKDFTTLNTRSYNDRISDILGRRVTSRSVREHAIDAVLADSCDPASGVIDYDAAARRTHHASGNTLRNHYHKRPVDRTGRIYFWSMQTHSCQVIDLGTCKPLTFLPACRVCGQLFGDRRCASCIASTASVTPQRSTPLRFHSTQLAVTTSRTYEIRHRTSFSAGARGAQSMTRISSTAASYFKIEISTQWSVAQRSIMPNMFAASKSGGWYPKLLAQMWRWLANISRW